MNNDDLPTFPCPLCDSCDHDMRGGLLELMENLSTNLKNAGEALLDALEAAGPASEKFLKSSQQFISVRRQIALVLDTIPDIAVIKLHKHS